MSDRRTLAIGAFFVALMLVTGLWRYMTLVDLTILPRYSPNGKSFVPTSPARLLLDPAALSLFIAGMSLKDWLKKGDEDELRPWRRRNAQIMLLVGLSLTLMHFSMIESSLPNGRIWDAREYFRAVAVFVGVAIVALSNAAPKLPWLSYRFRALSLSEESGTRLLRGIGYSGVVMGLVIIAAASFASHYTLASISIVAAFCTVMLGPLLWCRQKLRRSY